LPAIQPDLIPRTEVAVAAAGALDLSTIDLADVALAKFGDWRKAIAEAKVQHATIAWDLSTAKGMKDIKSFRERECAAPQAEANKVGNALVTKLTAVSKLVRAEQAEKVTAYKELAAPLTKLIDDRQAEIDAEEIRKAEEAKAKQRAEDARLQGLRDQVDEALASWITLCGQDGMTSDRIGHGIQKLELVPTPEIAFDVAEHWRVAKADTLKRMDGLKQQAAAREEAARLEAARVEAARIAAEQAERDRQLAEREAAVKLQAEVTEAFDRAWDRCGAELAYAVRDRFLAAHPDESGKRVHPDHLRAYIDALDALQAHAPAPATRPVWPFPKTVSAADAVEAQAAAEAVSHAAGAAAGEAENPGTCAEAAQVNPNAHDGSVAAAAALCASSEAEAAEASPSGDEGTARADHSAPVSAPLASLRGLLQPDQVLRFNDEDLRIDEVAVAVCPDAAEAERIGAIALSASFDGPDDDDDEGGIDVAPMVAATPTRVILLEPDDAPDPDQLVTDYRELVRLVRSGLGEVPAGWWQALREHCDAAAPRLDAYLGAGA
jgi:hypothetical protein